jgi:hypothetical protein
MPETTLERLERVHRAAGQMAVMLHNLVQHSLTILEEIEELRSDMGNAVNQWRREDDSSVHPSTE